MTKKFKFTAENKRKADAEISKYPDGRQKSAVMGLLDIAQRQNHNWLSQESMDYVAEYLGMAPIRVYEIATFYTMYNLKPVGKFLFQVCGTTPCALRGAEDIISTCKEAMGVDLEGSSEDGNFTLKEVECLGACANAPVIQINDDYYEDLTVERVQQIIETLRQGRKIKAGSQTNRQSSEPINKQG